MKRMILPVIKKYWKLLLSIVVVSAMGCGLMSGMAGAFTSLEYSLNKYVRDNRYPDAYITTDVVNKKLAQDILAVEGVDAVNTRLCGDTMLLSSAGRYLSVRVFSHSDSDLQRFHIWESADAGEQDSIMLEYNFAVDNGIKAGEVVSVRVGEEMRDYAISAIVSAPETLKVQITDDAWGSHSDFGYVYAPIVLLEKEDKKERDNAMDELDEQGDKLNDAEKEAKGQLDDAEQQLKDAEALLAEKDNLFGDAQQTAMDKKRQLEETRRQLISTRSRLQDTLRELDASRPKLVSGISQLNDGIALLRQAKQALADIDGGIAELNDTRAQLTDSSVSGSVDMLRSLNSDISLDNLFEAADRLWSFTDVAAGYGINLDFSSEINSALNRIMDYIDRVEADRDYLGSEQVSDILNRAAAGEITTDDPDLITLVKGALHTPYTGLPPR